MNSRVRRAREIAGVITMRCIGGPFDGTWIPIKADRDYFRPIGIERSTGTLQSYYHRPGLGVPHYRRDRRENVLVWSLVWSQSGV